MAVIQLNADMGDDGSGDGSASAPFLTIAHVVDNVASPGDTIYLQSATATYAGWGSKQFDSIDLIGQHPGLVTVNPGGGEFGILGTCKVASITFDGWIMSDRQDPFFAANEEDITFTLTGCRFTNCTYQQNVNDPRGGVFSQGGRFTINSSFGNGTWRAFGNAFLGMVGQGGNGVPASVFGVMSRDGVVAKEFIFCSNTVQLVEDPTYPITSLFQAGGSAMIMANNVFVLDQAQDCMVFRYGSTPVGVNTNNVYNERSSGVFTHLDPNETGAIVTSATSGIFNDYAAGDLSPASPSTLEQTGKMT